MFLYLCMFDMMWFKYSECAQRASWLSGHDSLKSYTSTLQNAPDYIFMIGVLVYCVHNPHAPIVIDLDCFLQQSS